MATVRAPGVSPSGPTTDLVAHNEELLRIVEKQRIIIQNLQKSLALMTDERDNLLERNQDLEQELIMTTQLDVRRTDPSSTEKNDHRQKQQDHHHQQEQQQQQQVQQEPKKEPHHLLADTIEATMLGGPVPPPRSPYRAQQKDSTPSPSSTNSSSSNLAVMSSVLERYGTPDSSSESRMGATLVEPSLPATYAYENRSRAPSPSPSPTPYHQHQQQQQRSHHGIGNNNNYKDNNKDNGNNNYNYNNQNNHNNHHHVNQDSYHDNINNNMKSSSRSISPANNHHHHQQQQQQQQHTTNGNYGNGNYINNGSNIELPESFSNTTLDLSLPPVVDAMVDKDAQLFAKYQGAIHKKEADSYHHQQQQQEGYYQYSQKKSQQYQNETTLSPPPGRKPVVEQQSHHPLSPVEQNTDHHHHQQQQQKNNYQYQQYQQDSNNNHHHTKHIPPQIQIDHHHRQYENENYMNRSGGEDHVQQRHMQHQHSSETASYHSNTRTVVEQEPTTPQSVATPTTYQHYQQQQSPSSPQGGGFSSGPMAGINTKVIGSDTIRNDKGKEVVTFTISVRKAKDTTDPNSPLEELWQIQKLYSDFLALDAQLKSQGKSVASKIAKLPDRALFVTHVPSKVDQRKMAVDNYLQHAIRLPLADITDICEFLSSNVMEKQAQPKVSKYRQGYLTKRGKNFGGWKRRYFLLDGPDLKYYESEEGQFLGKIHLTEAQIGKQKQAENSKEAPTFKHGLIIIEPKKSAPGGLARHVLCADSDEERDAWVDAMTQHIDQDAVTNRQNQNDKKKSKSSSDKSNNEESSSNKPSIDLSTISDPSAASASHLERLLAGTDAYQKMNAAAAAGDGNKKDKGRKGFWGKKVFHGNSNGKSSNATAAAAAAGDWRKENSDPPGPNQVFGIPLEDAIKVAKVSDQYELPAIVYRCIDYLEAKGAIQEEGIYRLSGSAIKIRNLKSKFNEEGDVDLLASDEHHDIHAVSGLLKLWLRELPGNVLTTELLKEFLNVMDLVDRRERINELGRLVSMLPLQNYTLLRTLSAHLIRVVQNAGTNKMTIRNVGIVFSATLGIPTGIFSLLLTEFDYIFWTGDGNPVSGNPPPPTTSSNNNGSSSAVNQDPASYFPPPPSSKPPPPPQTNNHHYHHQQQQQMSSSGRVQALQEEPAGRSNRNSVSYMLSAPRSIVGLEKNGNRGPMVVADDDDEVDDLAIDFSDEEHSTTYRTAERQPYIQPTQYHSNNNSHPPTATTSTPAYPTVDPHHYASRYY
ncbi:hypothetical protein BDA99DRAFT_19660 [Phascolomyces articulosus]|uniref:RhoGAP-domain-containing protein n=1 Tax=Phascolomyces articulosus TaxID=60185 RepID=A0AAD5KD34_9FUNG|nr:hypothetical protein BDA99DRAFT_19660 [Phascolomyces articulosus]